MTDQEYLRQAVRIGNLQTPPRNSGAIVVKDGEIIASDHNHVHEAHDPSAHAEIGAIRMACAKLGTHNLEGCILYSSHEPCLMCFSCAAWARMDRVVYAEPADATGYTYEFEGIRLAEIATHLSSRPIKVDLISLDPPRSNALNGS